MSQTSNAVIPITYTKMKIEDWTPLYLSSGQSILSRMNFKLSEYILEPFYKAALPSFYSENLDYIKKPSGHT